MIKLNLYTVLKCATYFVAALLIIFALSFTAKAYYDYAKSVNITTEGQLED